MSLKKLIQSALLIALAYIGSFIKIFGSIAFDSFPAFLGGLLLGPVYGMLIGFFGHFFTAMLSGFPYGLVVHFIIACSMGITVAVFSISFRCIENKVLSFVCYLTTGLIGVLLNAPLSLSLLYPLLGKAIVLALLPVLTIASAANIVIAFIIYNRVKS